MNPQEYFQKINEKQVVLAYKARMAPEVLRAILSTTETNLTHSGEKVQVRKKIFNILVELIQNLIKHVDLEAQGERANSTITVVKEDESYLISTGNYIRKYMSREIQKRIELLNGMSKDEIRKFYMESMDKNELSAKGGAGLGLIDIIRKSGEKMDCFIDPVDEHLDYLILQIRVVNKIPSEV